MSSRPLSRGFLHVILALGLLVALTASLGSAAAQAPATSEITVFCVNPNSGLTRAATNGNCAGGFQRIDITQSGPLTLCSRGNSPHLIYPKSGQCKANETVVILGGQENVTVCVGHGNRFINLASNGQCKKKDTPALVPRAPYEFSASYDVATPLFIQAGAGDHGYTFASVTVDLPAGATVEDVNVTLDIAHDFFADLRIFLVAPDGTYALLIDDTCYDAVDAVLTLDDAATTSVLDAGCDLDGTFSPAPEQLSRFNGTTAAGAWSLIIVDNWYDAPGVLNDWSLELTSDGSAATYVCDDCPANITQATASTGTQALGLAVADSNAGNITDINVTVDASLGFMSEFVTLTLVSPSGTEVLLYDGACELAPNFLPGDLRLIYDDAADAPLSSADCPVDGFPSYQPAGPLAAFNGENPNGQWTLRVTNNTINDFPGIIWSWGLAFTTD